MIRIQMGTHNISENGRRVWEALYDTTVTSNPPHTNLCNLLQGVCRLPTLHNQDQVPSDSYGLFSTRCSGIFPHTKWRKKETNYGVKHRHFIFILNRE
jgi:hypothetical protein